MGLGGGGDIFFENLFFCVISLPQALFFIKMLIFIDFLCDFWIFFDFCLIFDMFYEKKHVFFSLRDLHQVYFLSKVLLNIFPRQKNRFLGHKHKSCFPKPA